ncbi:UNVERIFIED_CONTAM: hypothetical protein FKN15_036108, partial [Acipenser sinensis]
VLVELTRQESQETVLALNIAQLGTEVKLRPYDLTVTSYLKKVTLDYCEIRDPQNRPFHLISSSDKPGLDLLKVEFIKADNSGPNFKATFDNTEQTLKVAFSSLNLLLHTQALLSTISFMTAALPSSIPGSAGKDQQPKSQGGESEKGTVAKTVSKGSKDKAIFDLKVFAVLDSFHVVVCDERRKIADIKVQGLDASVFVQTRETQVSARLRDIIVTDIDSSTIHHKVGTVHIPAQLYSYYFNMALYPNATEGDAYTDTSNVDGKVTLRVGCIQIVYLHKFLMSLLKFVDNFQTAKEALSVATAQAAEKAASSVRDFTQKSFRQAASSMRDFAQKSFRLSMDIKLKAPVIIIPQSSVSQNAVEADLGLITVHNQFCLVPADGCSLPPVIDKMDVQLTKLKLSRILLQEGSVQPNIELLQPVNLRASVKRNLAAAWYQKIPAIEINGDLKPMKVLLRLKESNVLDSKELYETMKFDFNFESLSLVLYNSDPTLISVVPPTLQKAPLSQRQDSLRLGEFILHLMTASGKMFEDGALEASTKLTACTLDDCRQGIQRVTSRMVDKKDDGGDSVMIDLSFTQSQSESLVVAVLQKLYVCASVEFLLAVADFFIKAMPQGPSATPNKSNQLQLKQVNVPRAASEKAPDSSLSKMKIKAVIDPEVVFVASLMKADAPALAASFQCDFTLVSEGASQKMTASLRELKVLACPFLRQRRQGCPHSVVACLFNS